MQMPMQMPLQMPMQQQMMQPQPTPVPFYAPQMFPAAAMPTVQQSPSATAGWVNPYITSRPQITCPGMPYADPARTIRERGPYFIHHLTGVLAWLEQWIPSQQVLAAFTSEMMRETKGIPEARKLFVATSRTSYYREVALGVIRRMICGDLGPGAFKTLAAALIEVERLSRDASDDAQDLADKVPENLKTIADAAAHLVLQSRANLYHATEAARAFIPEATWDEMLAQERELGEA